MERPISDKAQASRVGAEKLQAFLLVGLGVVWLSLWLSRATSHRTVGPGPLPRCDIGAGQGRQDHGLSEKH